MIYLHRLLGFPRPAAARAPRRPIAPWLPALAAMLILVLSAHFRSEVSPGFAPDGAKASPATDRERRHWQGLVDALRAEGAIRSLSPCRRFDVCVRVTNLFRGLDPSDKRHIGRGIRRYFETRIPGAQPVLNVRFLDAQTGVELGRYANGRLDWEGGF